jgi:hypothetical protein|tara:strand:- start:3322 stop:3549 length:228 start_codon:yes stop_codon:yes gene_type:complete
MLYSGAGVKAKVDQRFGIGVTVKEIQGVLLLETWPMFSITQPTFRVNAAIALSFALLVEALWGVTIAVLDKGSPQ